MGSRWDGIGSGILRNTAGFIKVTGLALFAALLCTSCVDENTVGGGGGVKKRPPRLS